jgi:hypothetical protein
MDKKTATKLLRAVKKLQKKRTVTKKSRELFSAHCESILKNWNFTKVPNFMKTHTKDELIEDAIHYIFGEIDRIKTGSRQECLNYVNVFMKNYMFGVKKMAA